MAPGLAPADLVPAPPPDDPHRPGDRHGPLRPGRRARCAVLRRHRHLDDPHLVQPARLSPRLRDERVHQRRDDHSPVTPRSHVPGRPQRAAEGRAPGRGRPGRLPRQRDRRDVRAQWLRGAIHRRSHPAAGRGPGPGRRGRAAHRSVPGAVCPGRRAPTAPRSPAGPRRARASASRTFRPRYRRAYAGACRRAEGPAPRPLGAHSTGTSSRK